MHHLTHKHDVTTYELNTKMMRRIVCLGYYHHHNLGDDCFEHLLPRLFPNHVVICVNPCSTCDGDLEDIRELINNVRTDAVVVGGGDLIRDFWMPQIKSLLIDVKKPRFAVSVGISYPDCAPYLQYMDRIIVRSTADLAMITPFRKDAIYLPDMSTMLIQDAERIRQQQEEAKDPSSPFHLAVCVAQPCIPTATNFASDLARAIIKFIDRATAESKRRRWKITLLPFNTNEAKPGEHDYLAQDHLEEALRKRAGIDVVNLKKRLSTAEALRLFCTFDLVIGMRYHSLLFSIVAKTLFIALHSQPKIRNLLIDLELTGTLCDHALKTDDKGRPTGRFDVGRLSEALFLMDKYSSETNSTNCWNQRINGFRQQHMEIQKDYETMLQLPDVEQWTPKAPIVKADNVLFMPNETTVSSIVKQTLAEVLHNDQLEGVTTRLAEFIARPEGEASSDALNRFLNVLERRIYAHCGMNACQPNQSLNMMKRYAWGLGQKLNDHLAGRVSCDVIEEMKWVIMDRIRHA